ncbi:hypothetical protein SASPL_105876 [Salvia splendens]|uniref:Uncharacterized protein n=1 Tax=Salvia splendens TaxID=180675 RepID=A0A8X9A926_SALSN|nr:hypothetical protein SASPL_105876 [Salvia splendens]
MVIRRGSVIFQSQAQVWGFNAPYQLHGRLREGPGRADEMAVEDVEAVMGRCLSEGLEPQMVARELAEVAHVNDVVLGVRNNVISSLFR